jgi:NtrC-family two-component system response regulator AlgB
MRILIVDHERGNRSVLAQAIKAIGNATVTAVSGSGPALIELKREPFEVVILDLDLSSNSVFDLLKDILNISPRASVVIIAARASLETAVEAMRRGASDYLPKPCAVEEIRQVLERIERTRKLGNKVAELESRKDMAEPEIDLTTQSPAMHRAIEIAFRAAESDATILILGETGTGKSVLARAIHQRSPRAPGAFITVSCPSLSRELLESELFGHTRGAFTGAHADTFGKVAAADGGTLFLDEIGELPLDIQSKLLRLLQEREYERVGDARPQHSNVRVIAATNRDLDESVAAGRFRKDLFYRLNVISITIPPLRDRTCDLEHLLALHLRFFASREGKRINSLSHATLKQLRAYHWPGNLRELRNLIERLVILSTGNQIDLIELGETARQASDLRLGAKVTLEQIKTEHIRRILANTPTLKDAAEILGIDPTTLYRNRARCG